jgi:hypothetical protein
MRSVSSAGTIYGTKAASLGPGRRVDFVQSAEPGDLAAGVARIAAELDAEAGTDWVLTFIDLAGAGDGHTFVFMLTWADQNAGGIVTDGLDVEDLAPITAMASQSEAIARASFAANAAVVAPAGLFFQALQSFLAGTSSGTRFVTGTVGELEGK